MNVRAASAPLASSVVSWPSARYAWYVLGVLVLAYGFAILDRIVIGLLVQPVKAALSITDAEIGLLQGLAFAICYTTFGLVLGLVSDRTSRRWVFILGVLVWSLATVACGFAPNFRWLFVARIFVGLGEACILPVAGSLLSDYFRPDVRPKAYSLFLLGGTLGMMLGYVLGAVTITVADSVRVLLPGLLGDLQNWQISFVVAGMPGLLVALLVFLTVREPQRRETISEGGKVRLGPLLDHLRTNARAYVALLLGTVLNVTGNYAQMAWAATLIIRVHGWTPVDAGNALAMLASIGIFSSFLVGWTVSKLAARGHSDAPLIAAMITSATMILFGPLASLAPSPLWALAPFCLLSVTTNWSSASALMGLAQITPNELRGQATALYTLLTGLISMTVGGYAVGFLTDNIFTEPTGIAPAMAAVFACMGVLGLVVLGAGRKAFRAAAARAEAWAGR